ncbi:MAG: asparaginase [Myxococcaceae bacterium]|nr:asparaginase [Myxococcaceae bacterium]
MSSLFIEQRRGFAVEAVHAIDAVSCDASGDVRVLSGIDTLTTFRSASKPFQLEVSVELLSELARSHLSATDLALGTASHHGEPFHLEALARLLTKLGVAQSELLCGAHSPLSLSAAHALLARGEEPTVLCNNCAGKHAFMVAASRAQDFPADYRPVQHPLQQAIRERLEARTAYGLADSVVDGCGVPCFVLKLSAMARAYASLARETRLRGPSALSAIGRAMRDHPVLVSGSDAFDGWLMEHTSAIAKVGAAGLLCIAVPERALGIAIKVSTGSEAIRPIATAAILERFVPGLLHEVLPARYRLVHNVVGAEVGELVTRFEEG